MSALARVSNGERILRAGSVHAPRRMSLRCFLQYIHGPLWRTAMAASMAETHRTERSHAAHRSLVIAPLVPVMGSCVVCASTAPVLGSSTTYAAIARIP